MAAQMKQPFNHSIAQIEVWLHKTKVNRYQVEDSPRTVCVYHSTVLVGINYWYSVQHTQHV